VTDEIIRVLADYALGVDNALPAATSTEVRRKLIDVVACALAGLHEPATHATRRYVYDHRVDGPSLVWGTGVRTSPELAAVANGAAVRCLDFNDGYQGTRGDAGGHPSDIVPGLLGVAEMVDASGEQFAAAVAIGYEVMVSLADGWRIKKHGVLDHVNGMALAACCGTARLMGLSNEQLREALAISSVAHVGLWQARKNQVRMWKSVAAGNAFRNAIECCYMARAGVQGPSKPFEGSAGLLHAAGDEDGLAWDVMTSLVEQRPPTRICDTNMKCWPVGQVGQTSVDVAVELHNKLADPADIVQIDIYTFANAARSMCRPDNWRPKTRESADHSLPWATVAALYDGVVTSATFHEDRLEHSGIQERLDTIVRVEVLDEFTEQYPEAQPARIEVTLRDGSRESSEATYPRGHARNPNRVGDEDYAQKFILCAEPVLGPKTHEVLDVLGSLHSVDSVRSITDALVL
jgi:2-methylcitrate dehydratase